MLIPVPIALWPHWHGDFKKNLIPCYFGTEIVKREISAASYASDLTYIVALLRDRKTQQILSYEVGAYSNGVLILYAEISLRVVAMRWLDYKGFVLLKSCLLGVFSSKSSAAFFYCST